MMDGAVVVTVMADMSSRVATMSEEMENLYSELFEAAGAGRRIGESYAARAGQTQARWQTLWTMDVSPMTVPQVARRLGVSRQHILRLTNVMVHEGLVELLPNPDHKTSPLVNLTPKGQATLNAINEAARISNNEVMQEFTAANVAQLRSLLRRFTKIIETSESSLQDKRRH
jgi:DNA-binding MarR family transcriptional regulator